jgi:hypothetical protein
MKRVVALAVVLAAIYFGGVEGGFIPSQQGGTSASSADQVSAAFENRQSNVQLQGSGAVTRMLPDDNDGSRHQRFIIQLRSGQTVLVAHNIDLAERVASLAVGDRVEFYGEYEWNEKGGVIHWTHRDPDGRRDAGWIRHEGRLYQ